MVPLVLLCCFITDLYLIRFLKAFWYVYIYVMADSIKDIVKELSIELNLPTFMEEKFQLLAKQIQKGCKITFLHMYVERAIGRITL